MKRGSMELSVNFLVVMIISIVLLGFGILLLKGLISESEDMTGKLSEQESQRLIGLMDNGALTAVYPTSTTVARGDRVIFGLGITNEIGEEKTFGIDVVEDAVNSPKHNDPFKILYIRSIQIKNKEKYATPISIEAPKGANKGTYIFNVFICKSYASGVLCNSASPELYEKQKIYVNIK